MTNPMYNPPQNYSGVTIQISNPAVNVGQKYPYTCPNQQDLTSSCSNHTSMPQNSFIENQTPQVFTTNPQQTIIPTAYPPQYYLNNYNYQGVNDNRGATNSNITNGTDSNNSKNKDINDAINSYKHFASDNAPKEDDLSKSQNIINELDERGAEIEAQKKNTKETKIVALTDEYIKSLENYLNNPNDEIRLMASKEILTRLDEDKDRCNDAALNALLNKMMQDPSKLIRVAALSAFASGLASGNNYTVTLLHNIQSNPNSDKEDVLQAADILLKMTAGTEIKNIPNPQVKKEEGDKE